MEKTSDYKKAFRWAFILTMIEWCGYVILSIWENVDVLDNLRSILILIWVLIVPIFVIWGWFNCIKCYLYLQGSTLGEQNTLLRRIWIYISIIIMILFGNATWNGFQGMVDYITENRNLLDGLSDCINLKIGIFVGWLFCFVGSIMWRKTFSAKGKHMKKIILCMCAVLSICGLRYFEKSKESYIYERTEDVWMQKMTAYYEENGIGADVEPFSRN